MQTKQIAFAWIGTSQVPSSQSLNALVWEMEIFGMSQRHQTARGLSICEYFQFRADAR